jgi:chromosome segregation ATPase
MEAKARKEQANKRLIHLQERKDIITKELLRVLHVEHPLLVKYAEIREKLSILSNTIEEIENEIKTVERELKDKQITAINITMKLRDRKQTHIRTKNKLEDKEKELSSAKSSLLNLQKKRKQMEIEVECSFQKMQKRMKCPDDTYIFSQTQEEIFGTEIDRDIHSFVRDHMNCKVAKELIQTTTIPIAHKNLRVKYNTWCRFAKKNTIEEEKDTVQQIWESELENVQKTMRDIQEKMNTLQNILRCSRDTYMENQYIAKGIEQLYAEIQCRGEAFRYMLQQIEDEIISTQDIINMESNTITKIEQEKEEQENIEIRDESEYKILLAQLNHFRNQLTEEEITYILTIIQYVFDVLKEQTRLGYVQSDNISQEKGACYLFDKVFRYIFMFYPRIAKRERGTENEVDGKENTKFSVTTKNSLNREEQTTFVKEENDTIHNRSTT